MNKNVKIKDLTLLLLAFAEKNLQPVIARAMTW
jgi:hypothetical protein